MIFRWCPKHRPRCLWGEYDSDALEIIVRSRDSTLAAKTAAGFIEGALDVIDAAGLDAPEPSLETTAVVTRFGLVGYATSCIPRQPNKPRPSGYRRAVSRCGAWIIDSLQ
jgi:hypothetical protein